MIFATNQPCDFDTPLAAPRGASGWVIIGGKIVRGPPRGPKYALLQALVALEAAEDIDHPLGQKVVQQTAEAIAGIAKDLAKGTKI